MSNLRLVAAVFSGVWGSAAGVVVSRPLPALPSPIVELEALAGPHRLLYAATGPRYAFTGRPKSNRSYVCDVGRGTWRELPSHDALGRTAYPDGAVLLDGKKKIVTLFDASGFRSIRTWAVDFTPEARGGGAVVSKDGRSLAYIVKEDATERIRLVGPDGKEQDAGPWAEKALQPIDAVLGVPRERLGLPGGLQFSGDDGDGNLIVDFYVMKEENSIGAFEITLWIARLSRPAGELVGRPWRVGNFACPCGSYGAAYLDYHYETVHGSGAGLRIAPDATIKIVDLRNGQTASRRPPQTVTEEVDGSGFPLASSAGGAAVACQFMCSSGPNRYERNTYVCWIRSDEWLALDKEGVERPAGARNVVGPFRVIAVSPDASWVAWVTRAQSSTVRVATLVSRRRPEQNRSKAGGRGRVARRPECRDTPIGRLSAVSICGISQAEWVRGLE